MDTNDDDNAAVLNLIASFLGPTNTNTTESTTLNAISATAADTDNDGITENIFNTTKAGPITSSTVDRNYKVIIFTKDRPWQLQQLLKSMNLDREFHHQQQEGEEDNTHHQRASYEINIDIFIIAHVTKQFQQGYSQVHDEYNTKKMMITKNNGLNLNITWLYETIATNDNDFGNDDECSSRPDNHTFAQLLEYAILSKPNNSNDEIDNNIRHYDHTSSSLLMFLTDDCILLEPLIHILQTAHGSFFFHTSSSDNDGSALFTKKHSLFGFYTRLHPGISWCQTRNEISLPPRHHLTYLTPPCCDQKEEEGSIDIDNYPTATANTAGGDGAFVYPRKYASNEWDYPFDLSGGIYQTFDIIVLLDAMKKNSNSNKSRRGSGDDADDVSTSSYNIACTMNYSHPNKFEINANRIIKEVYNKQKNKNKPLTTTTTTTTTTSESQQQANSLEETICSKDLYAIPTHPYLVILAINRVQNVYQAPLAFEDDDEEDILEQTTHNHSSAGKKEEEDNTEYSVDALLDVLRGGKHLDLEKYKSSIFHTSHIGNVYLVQDTDNFNSSIEIKKCSKPNTAAASSTTTTTTTATATTTALSVLIPIHCGPASAAEHAIRSILYQPVEEIVNRSSESTNNTAQRIMMKPTLLPMQIVIVDDRCQDGSIDAMIQEAKTINKKVPFLHIHVNDHRNTTANTTKLDYIPPDATNDQMKMGVTIDIVQTQPPGGIGRTLNIGLKHCTSEYVARMDADDISSPSRLVAQLKTLRDESLAKTNVLGTCSVIFRDYIQRNSSAATLNASGNNAPLLTTTSTLPYKNQGRSITSSAIEQYEILRSSVPPGDAGFVAWSLMFSCVISHPSVMYRKSTLISIGGYDEDLTSAEDYDLWLRMVRHDAQCIQSLPRLGLWHRKHQHASQRKKCQDNKDTKKVIQEKESLELIQRHILTIIEDRNDSSDSFSKNTPHCDTIQALTNPDKTSSLEVLDEASKMLCILEEKFIERYKEQLKRKDKAFINADCDARIGEIATIALNKFGPSMTKRSEGVWSTWCRRCPHLNLERLALLCHASCNSTKQH